MTTKGAEFLPKKVKRHADRTPSRLRTKSVRCLSGSRKGNRGTPYYGENPVFSTDVLQNVTNIVGNPHTYTGKCLWPQADYRLKPNHHLRHQNIQDSYAWASR